MPPAGHYWPPTSSHVRNMGSTTEHPLGRYAYGRTQSFSLFLILSVQCDLKRKCTALLSVAASAAYFETAFLVSIHHRGTWKGILVASFTSPRGDSTISSEVDVPLS